MSYAKLKGRIIEVFGSQGAFAKALGISSVSLSKRLNGRLEWTSSEIAKSCELLGVPLEQNVEYFFTRKVKES